ncbi:MAG: hypothetical protein GY853_16395 [PVC group bacterium]|nr:hypothetical protein [PVC group bacterium]
MMVYYKYSKIDGKLTGIHKPAIDVRKTKRLGKESYLLPKNVTEISPPEMTRDESCFFEDGEWVVYQNKVVYKTATGEEVIVNGKCDIPTWLTEKPKPDGDYKWVSSIGDWEKIPPLPEPPSVEEIAIQEKAREILRRMAIAELEAEK